MLVNIKKFRKLLKDQYKTEEGLIVGMTAENLYLAGEGWEFEVIMEHCCKEVKAQIIELLGFIPVEGEKYSASREDVQKMLWDDCQIFFQVGIGIKITPCVIKKLGAKSKGTRLFVTSLQGVHGISESFCEMFVDPDMEAGERVETSPKYIEGSIYVASTFCRMRIAEMYVPESIKEAFKVYDGEE